MDADAIGSAAAVEALKMSAAQNQGGSAANPHGDYPASVPPESHSAPSGPPQQEEETSSRGMPQDFVCIFLFSSWACFNPDGSRHRWQWQWVSSVVWAGVVLVPVPAPEGVRLRIPKIRSYVLFTTIIRSDLA